MQRFGWKEEYSLDLPEMDEQHREIFRCLEALEAAVAACEAPAGIVGRLHKARKHSVFHFASEEKLLAAIEFPDTVKQRVQHRQFIKRIDRAVEWAGNPPGKDVSLAQVHELQSWILGHVVGLDREYAEFLRKRGSS